MYFGVLRQAINHVTELPNWMWKVLHPKALLLVKATLKLATDVEKTSDFQNSPPLFSEYSVYICYLDSFYYRSLSFRINIKALLRTFKKEKSALF